MRQRYISDYLNVLVLTELKGADIIIKEETLNLSENRSSIQRFPSRKKLRPLQLHINKAKRLFLENLQETQNKKLE